MSTESFDSRFINIDSWPLEDAVSAMWEGQARAIASLEGARAEIAAAAQAAAERLAGDKGRLIYVGAGTSGRIGVQDGVELVPTFDWDEARLHYLLAGGMAAMMRAVEGAEDDEAAAIKAVDEAALTPDDVLIAIAASGRTPFTCAALEAAKKQGALTIAIANNAPSRLLEMADFAVHADTGAEVIAGSTRMGAGTAQKAAVNMLSSAIMLALGRVYQGRMVAMRATNAKLLRRANAMVCALTGTDETAAASALAAAGQDVRLAVLIASGAEAGEARALLSAHQGKLADALAAFQLSR